MKLKQRNLIFAGVFLLALLVLIRFMYPGRREGFQSGMDNFVLYYADWCPHCKTVKPAFKEFSGSGTLDVKGKKVGCSMVESSSMTPEDKKNVKGFPTILLKRASGATEEYDGPRNAGGWKSWLETNL